MESEELICRGMTELVQSHGSHINMLEVDEVVFSYIAGILTESLDDVDMEEFIAIMDAYVPGFALIPQADVVQFLNKLAADMNSETPQNNTIQPPPSDKDSSADVKPRRRTRRNRLKSESGGTIQSTSQVGDSCTAATTRSIQQRTFSESSSVSEYDWPFLADHANRPRLDSGCGSLGVDNPHFVSELSQSLSECINDLSIKQSATFNDDTVEVKVEFPTKATSMTASSEVIVDRTDDIEGHEAAVGAEGEDDETVSPCDEYAQAIRQLVEIFPDNSKAVIENSLQNNGNDLERTVSCLLAGDLVPTQVLPSNRKHKPTKGSNITVDLTATHTSRKKRASGRSRRKSNSQSNDDHPGEEEQLQKLSSAEMKALIVDKYSYYPTDADAKTYIPKLQSSEDKKMVRYRDGQVVSTKGERFSEVKTTLTEDMKKTYINLKPAKQYRFH